MRIETGMTSDELLSATCSQAYFGRLIGISKMRVNQLLKEGLLLADDSGGVKIFPSLTRWLRYKYQSEPIYRFVYQLDEEEN